MAVRQRGARSAGRPGRAGRRPGPDPDVRPGGEPQPRRGRRDLSVRICPVPGGTTLRQLTSACLGRVGGTAWPRTVMGGTSPMEGAFERWGHMRDHRAAAYDDLPDGVLVAGADGEVVALNAAGARLLGMSADSALGRDYRAVIPLADSAGRDWWACTDPYGGLWIRTGQPERLLELSG